MIDTEKLNKWSKEIYDIAVAHGWHEEKHSPEHYLGLIMTEVAEAVEADRKNRYYVNTVTVPTEKDNKHYFQYWYENHVKGTVSEEFADIVIRLLDMTTAIYGELEWHNFDNLIHAYSGVYFKQESSFVENAWFFTHNQLNKSIYDILKSIQFVDMWAEHLNIDLDQHIEWKMKYNSLRPYKHGGKKY